MDKILYPVEEVFNSYTEYKYMKKADIFHFYDTGDQCLEKEDGFINSRWFELIAFNSKTKQKRKLGRRDGVDCNLNIAKTSCFRVYADGSFLVSFREPVKFLLFQCVRLE